MNITAEIKANSRSRDRCLIIISTLCHCYISSETVFAQLILLPQGTSHISLKNPESAPEVYTPSNDGNVQLAMLSLYSFALTRIWFKDFPF